MKKILIVEDQPELKVEMLISLLKTEHVAFEYEIVGSVTSAKRYLSSRKNKVDAIIMDLGLPTFDGEWVTNLHAGEEIINDLDHFEVRVPVIINSTTSISNFESKKAAWERMGLEIYKTDFILHMRSWFVKFLKE